MPWTNSKKIESIVAGMVKEPCQIMHVYTKGQLMAAVECYTEEYPTVIVVHKKDGNIFHITQQWTEPSSRGKDQITNLGIRTPIRIIDNEITLSAIKKKIRKRIKAIPAKTLLGSK